MNFVRWFLILVANTAPVRTRRWAAKVCRTRVPPYPEEKGAFRTDVAICAFGILRAGDVGGFTEYLRLYPFEERWMGFYPRDIYIPFPSQGRRWAVFSSVNVPRRFGKAVLPARQDA